MRNPIKYIGCYFVGHKINPKESIMLDVMINPNSLLCPCHRCGFYMIYDSSSGMGMTLTKKQAYKTKQDFIKELGPLFEIPEEVMKTRKMLYGDDTK